VYCFGDPKKMSDESVRLALRIHDEVCLDKLFIDNLKQADHDGSAMAAMSSDRIFAHAGHISHSESKKR
jgi:hypothetical protein